MNYPRHGGHLRVKKTLEKYRAVLLGTPKR